mmetsp:Transcript_126341/g.342991  ORF Transcript_126341/g.342991 Transcript_126341/m.342991 type:complete len:274 (+) Transcript_126341:41-862(+)
MMKVLRDAGQHARAGTDRTAASRPTAKPWYSSHRQPPAPARSPHGARRAGARAAQHPREPRISLGGHGRELGRLFPDVRHAANHVERGLGDVIAGARQHLLEVVDGGLEVHESPRSASKDLGHEEGLRQEALHLPSARDGELVLLAQLVHAEDGDDVLERLVVLQDLLGAAGDVVVALPDDRGVQHAGGGVQGVDRRVDAELRDLSRQHRRGVEVREGGGRRRVGQVVGRHVHSLHRGDGALLGGGDALLQGCQVCGQRGLVADRAGNAPEQC